MKAAVKMIKEKQPGSAIVYSGILVQRQSDSSISHIFEPSFLD